MFGLITTTGRKLTWKLGEPKPGLVPPERVETFRATETAYSHIVTHMKGIPKALYSDTTIWREPFAQFIYDNLQDPKT